MTSFTIITITFNAARVISRTLKSVERQTWKAVEHIIIDGASTDKTLDIVNDYAADNRKYGTSADISQGNKEKTEAQPRHVIRIISEPDKGIYDAMNKGLRLATGDYIVFINAGDCLHDAHTLEDIATHAGLDSPSDDNQQRPAVIYGDTDITDGDGVFMHKRGHRPPTKLTWRSFKQGMLVCHQAFYARRDIAASIPYDMSYRFSADIDWCIKVLREAEKRRLPIVNTRITVADYMREGMSTVHHRASLNERFTVMRRHYGLSTTIIMHLWFVFRALWRKIKG